jgi:hypothetical protein
MSDDHFLKSVVFKIKDDQKKIVPPTKHLLLPVHPFSWALVGSSRSGKSTFLFNVLLRFYDGYFEKVYICSSSYFVDDSYSILHGRIPDNQICTNIDEIGPFIDAILAEQSSLENNKKQKVLLVVDDFGASTAKITALNHLAKIRHSNISCVVVVQKLYSWLKPAVRVNLTHVSLFGSGTASERKSICAEFARYIEPQEMQTMWDDACKTIGDFLHLFIKGDSKTYYSKNIFIPITVSR